MPRERSSGPFNPFGDFGFPGPARPRLIVRIPRRPAPRGAGLGFGAVPLPVPQPTPQPFPFPGGPAANDAIYRRWPGGIGGVIVGGVIGVIIVETGVEITKRVIKLKKQRKEREEEAEREGISRREERVARDRVVKTIPNPSKVGDIIGGKFPPRPDIPTGGQAPKIPRPVGDPVGIPTPPLPAPPPRPVFEPGPVTLPTPGIPRAPARLPAGAPVPGIGTDPGVWTPTVPGRNPFPFPGGLPASSPVQRPVAFPVPTPVGDLFPQNPLTGFNPGGVGSMPLGFADVGPDASPQPEAQTQRCREVKRRRRRKGECSEGFYAEYPDRTRFTDWRNVDCVSRKPIN